MLADCIQIDSITVRKGRLQSIRKLLIKEYKKYFQKPSYKMETPFIGKRADTLNKLAIFEFFNQNMKKAQEFWSEALKLNDRHFDSQVNLSMYRWSVGIISDSELLDELGVFVLDFEQTGPKGRAIEAYL